jgi:hypothetical protein
VTHEEEVQAFFAKKVRRRELKAADWRAMGVQTDKMYAR